MFGLGKKKNEPCFFCPSIKTNWKIEVKTSEGILVKNVCDECANYLERIRLGESLYNLNRDNDDEEEFLENE